MNFNKKYEAEMKKKQYTGYDIVHKGTGKVAYSKTYSNLASQNTLRARAVSKMVTNDFNARAFEIHYKKGK